LLPEEVVSLELDDPLWLVEDDEVSELLDDCDPVYELPPVSELLLPYVLPEVVL
jgi:hypothetical protein